MAWTDIVALVLIVGVAWAESHRGFGRSLFDVVGAIISVRVAALVSEMLMDAAPVLSTAGGSHAFWYSATFLVLIALTILATKVIYDSILLSLDVLDPLAGGVIGVVSGLIVAHVFLQTLQLASTGDDVTALLNTFMGQELLQFRTYHTIVNALQNLGNW